MKAGPAPAAPRAYLVDDDAAIRDSLGWLLESKGVACSAYACAEDFLAAWSTDFAGCIVLDIRMGGMSGPELFEHLRGRGSRLPVIFLTGHGDVAMAVAAIKKGAFDFVEKPFNDNELVHRVVAAIDADSRLRDTAATLAAWQAQLETLTLRERQVMELVLAGKFNKVIADELNISMRTVEVHRAKVFDKLGVKTAVELAQRRSAATR
jgi:two-component system response regulator DctR